MTLEPLLWFHCSISGRCLLEYIIESQYSLRKSIHDKRAFTIKAYP